MMDSIMSCFALRLTKPTGLLRRLISGLISLRHLSRRPWSQVARKNLGHLAGLGISGSKSKAIQEHREVRNLVLAVARK